MIISEFTGVRTQDLIVQSTGMIPTTGPEPAKGIRQAVEAIYSQMSENRLLNCYIPDWQGGTEDVLGPIDSPGRGIWDVTAINIHSSTVDVLSSTAMSEGVFGEDLFPRMAGVYELSLRLPRGQEWWLRHHIGHLQDSVDPDYFPAYQSQSRWLMEAEYSLQESRPSWDSEGPFKASVLEFAKADRGIRSYLTYVDQHCPILNGMWSPNVFAGVFDSTIERIATSLPSYRVREYLCDPWNQSQDRYGDGGGEAEWKEALGRSLKRVREGTRVDFVHGGIRSPEGEWAVYSWILRWAEALQEYLPQMFPGRRVRVGDGSLSDLGVYFQELVTLRAGTRHHLGRAVSSHKRIETDPGVWVVNSHADTHLSLLAEDDPVLLSNDRLSMIDRCGWCFLSALLPSARRSAREQKLHYPNNANKRRGFLERMKPTTHMFTRGKAIR